MLYRVSLKHNPSGSYLRDLLHCRGDVAISTESEDVVKRVKEVTGGLPWADPFN